MHGRSSKRQRGQAAPASEEPQRVTLKLIADKLDRLTWRHQLMGVSERQAWHVIERLDEMYRQLYEEQRVHYEALLQEARRESSRREETSTPTQALPRSVPTLEPVTTAALGAHRKRG